MLQTSTSKENAETFSDPQAQDEMNKALMGMSAQVTDFQSGQQFTD